MGSETACPGSQSHVVDALARLETEVAAVKVQTLKTNGRMNKAEVDIAALDKHQAERTNNCPMVDVLSARVATLEGKHLQDDAKAATSARWLDRLWPLIWAGAGILGYLVMQHASTLLPLIAK